MLNLFEMFVNMSVIRYLEGVFEVVKEVLLGDESFKVCSIIVFGSAARPEDFIIGVSDVDVLVLTREEPLRRRYSFVACSCEVNVVFFTVDEFRRLAECGDPLTFMLRYRVILYDGCSRIVLKLKPKITEHTKYVLRKSIFAALGLSLESYYVLEDFVKALSHLCHSLRHLIRYKASFNGKFPVSDKEICEFCYGHLKNLYIKLSNLRRSKVGENDLRIAINEVIKLIGEELNLKVTCLEDLEDKVKGNVNLITAGELNNYIVFRVEVFENGKRKIIEIKDGKVREMSHIFF